MLFPVQADLAVAAGSLVMNLIQVPPALVFLVSGSGDAKGGVARKPARGRRQRHRELVPAARCMGAGPRFPAAARGLGHAKELKGSFGFEDLTSPAFIGATSVSILERLMMAKEKAQDGAAFHLITTDWVTDGDRFGELISQVDGSLRLQVLKKGKTDDSRMGKVRQCWREHLKLSSNKELYALLDGLHSPRDMRLLKSCATM